MDNINAATPTATEKAAKIKFYMLGTIEQPQTAELTYGVNDEVVVTVQNKIPYEEVLEMIQWCIDYIINDRPFISEPLKRIVQEFAVLKWYTNMDINFMHDFVDMKEIYENYDILKSFDLYEKVAALIDQKQLNFFTETLTCTMESIEKYRNSAKGIVDVLSADAQDSADTMQEALDQIGDDEKNKKIAQLIKFAEQISG